MKSYSYDELNQLIKTQFPDDLVNYEYDIRGKIVKASNMVSQVDYTMDTKSRVTGLLTSGLGAMSKYPQVAMALSYDANDNRTALQTNIGSLSYSYDIMNRMTGLQNSWGDSYGFSYDNLNRLVKLQRPGAQTDYSYLDSGVIAGISHSSSGVVKSALQYGYDQRNMPIQKRTLAGDLNYSYDGNGQLTGVSGIQSETFVYDSIGNRIIDQDGNYIYDQSSQRLIEDYLYMYNYDLNGNLIQKFPKDQSKEAFTYSYSSKNQLMSVSVLENPLGQVKRKVSYVYDVLGRRIQKSVWNKDAVSDPKKTYIRKYVYDGDNVLFEYDGSNNLIARYTHSPLKADDVLVSRFFVNQTFDATV